ncbi:MAG TPA: hypothetical protein VNJ03_16815 [Vicinamibacterales bacterium]|nr:hypothetical protein [Vicinamibacterales bacterium]
MTRRQTALAALCFLLLAIAWTWPVATRLGSRIPHDPGDPILNTWILWWNTQALPFTERWWNPPVFFPSAGTFALSEHLLGIAVFTAPFQLAGATPAAAYNVALILSYWLSGFFAFLLGRRLTGSIAGGCVAGVAFACAPYRASQLSHLQVLTAQWMPLALFALHTYLDDRRARWLVLFAIAWLLQAFSNGYYLLFFPVLLALWLAWFVRWHAHARAGLTIAAAFALSSIALVPSLLRYREVHATMGLTRTRGEMVLFSAHPDSLFKMPWMLRLWPDSIGRTQEDFLFPGVTAVLIVMAAAIVALRSSGFRQALRQRSPLLFYAVATGLMWWLAMGPAPDDAPMQAFVRPYTWLTILPGFSGLRAPSRFAMLAVLSLSVAAALATRRVVASRGAASATLAGLVVVGLLLDGWTVSIPLTTPAARFVLPGVKDSAVLELPADESPVNISAMYRAILHGRPLVNGYSGHTPPHYRILGSALRREDPSAIDFFAQGRPLVVVVDGRSDVNGDMQRFVRSLPAVQEQGGSSAGSVFVVPAKARDRMPAIGARIAPAAVRTEAREHVIIDLGRAQVVRAVGFPLRWHYDELGARLAVEASGDGVGWNPAWEGWTAALAIAGALEDQKTVPIRITLPDVNTRYLRIHPAPHWMVRELSVYAPR